MGVLGLGVMLRNLSHSPNMKTPNPLLKFIFAAVCDIPHTIPGALSLEISHVGP